MSLGKRQQLLAPIPVQSSQNIENGLEVFELQLNLSMPIKDQMIGVSIFVVNSPLTPTPKTENLPPSCKISAQDVLAYVKQLVPRHFRPTRTISCSQPSVFILVFPLVWANPQPHHLRKKCRKHHTLRIVFLRMIGLPIIPFNDSLNRQRAPSVLLAIHHGWTRFRTSSDRNVLRRPPIWRPRRLAMKRIMMFPNPVDKTSLHTPQPFILPSNR